MSGSPVVFAIGVGPLVSISAVGGEGALSVEVDVCQKWGCQFVSERRALSVSKGRVEAHGSSKRSFEAPILFPHVVLPPEGYLTLERVLAYSRSKSMGLQEAPVLASTQPWLLPCINTSHSWILLEFQSRSQ